jgi:hypothetical protein
VINNGDECTGGRAGRHRAPATVWREATQAARRRVHPLPREGTARTQEGQSMAEWLRGLDRLVLPPLARVLARLGRGLRRLRLLTLAGLASGLVLVLMAVWVADQAQRVDMTVGDVVRVGVTSDGSVRTYVADSRQRLTNLLAGGEAAGEEIYALVSLRAYLAPDRLTAVFGGVAVSRVYARVPLEHVQTEIVWFDAYRVPQDVEIGMHAVAVRKQAEARDYRQKARSLPAGSTQRRVYTTGAQVAGEEATAYDLPCPCVYAAVVRATPATLDLIVHRPEVRAVDPAPAVQRLDRAVFLPPLPEQVDRAVPPDDRALDPTSPVSPVPTLVPQPADTGSKADERGGSASQRATPASRSTR